MKFVTFYFFFLSFFLTPGGLEIIIQIVYDIWHKKFVLMNLF